MKPNNYKPDTAGINDLIFKRAYNHALKNARRGLVEAISLRKEIVSKNPSFAGPSTEKLEKALALTVEVRRFKVKGD